MARKLADWLSAFLEYSAFGEAPKRLYFWCGVSALAGALRRKVWIDQRTFCWYPNLYIVLVAPAGIIAKSTTADIAMDLLRQVKEVRFGPAVITWQALVKAFADAAEQFTVGSQAHVMSPITIVSSEFGNLINPQDKDAIDMLVNLWDGRSFTKATKGSGTDEVHNPWINLIACTTPDWIAGNLPEYMIGGGFTSRCIFVYAGEKAQYVPWPALVAPGNFAERRLDLIADLQHISKSIAGEYVLTPEALDWGAEWYERHYREDIKHFDPSRFGGYAARKQSLACKVAMVLAASRSDELEITKCDLETAVSMLSDLEPDMQAVFEKVGLTPESAQSERFTALVQARGELSYAEVYAWGKRYFPRKVDLEEVISAGIAARHYHYTKTPPIRLRAGPDPTA